MQLRLINTLEVNKEIKSLPDGVYGYSYGHTFSNVSENKENDFTRVKIEKRKLSQSERRYFFEVRKYSSDDIRLVGYVSDESQLVYGQDKGFSDKEIIIFPFTYESFKNCLEIQLYNEFLQIHERQVEDDELGIVSILEISKRVVDGIERKTELKDDKKKDVVHKNSSSSFIKQLILHPVYSMLVIAFIILGIYYLTGINLKDFSL